MSKELEALETLCRNGLVSQKEYNEARKLLEKSITKLDKIEEVIHDWERGKYGFSHEANGLHIKDIKKILKGESE